jgi:hypothetical protein
MEPDACSNADKDTSSILIMPILNGLLQRLIYYIKIWNLKYQKYDAMETIML